MYRRVSGAEQKPMPTPHPIPFRLLQPHLHFCLCEDDAHYVLGEKRILFFLKFPNYLTNEKTEEWNHKQSFLYDIIQCTSLDEHQTRLITVGYLHKVAIQILMCSITSKIP